MRTSVHFPSKVPAPPGTSARRRLGFLLCIQCMAAQCICFAATGGDHPADPSALPVPIAAPFVVVELFTSEGCSSCPPADKLLAEMAWDADKSGKRVFALSFHVDYWNGLGWADPFSRAGYSQRQEGYARASGGRMYTPQMIVNGGEGFVGSQGGTARRAVAAALGRPAAEAIALDVAKDGGAVRIGYRVTGSGGGDVINVALVEKGLSVPVPRGENGGRTLRHENVVRAFRTVRPDAGGAGSLRLEIPAGVNRDQAFLIAYTQGAQGASQRIAGAVRADLPR